MMAKYAIRNHVINKVQFIADIDCNETASEAVKIGLAVQWAIKSHANLKGADLTGANLKGANLKGADLTGTDLTGANLRGADLKGANLTGAYLMGAYLKDTDLTGADLTGAYLKDTDLTGAYLANTSLIDGGQRSDGYRFVGWIKDSTLNIRAGCRNFTILEARKHWQATRGGTPLGEETMCILNHIEAVACIRGLIKRETRNAG
jgi:hypothetical protein